MRTDSTQRWGSQLVVAAVFAVIGAVGLYLYVRFAEPKERQHREPFRADYSEDQLNQVLDGDGIDRQMAALHAAATNGSARSVGRFSGSTGFYNTEQLILKEFMDAGLEIRTQEFRVVVPVTEYAEVLDEQGQPVPGVTLYPLLPCGLTPTALPEGGIHGKLVVVESADLKYLTGAEPTNSIVLTYVDSSAGWPSLASVGVRALIVMEDKAAAALRSETEARDAWDTLLNMNEVAFPRFLVRGPLAEQAGKRLTLRCKVTWQERTVRNLVGVLKGKDPKAEALVLTTFYDSNSVVPELAPGAEQALSVAALLQYVKALAPYRGSLKRDVMFVATAGHAQSLAGVARLMEAVGDWADGRGGMPAFETLRKDEEIKLEYATKGLALLGDDARWAPSSREGFRERWMQEEPGFRTWFEKCMTTVAGEINLEHKEEALARRLTYLRADSPVFRDGFDPSKATDADRQNPANGHPLLRDFLKAQEMDNRSANMVSFPLSQMVAREEFDAWGFRDRARVYVQKIAAYHQQEIRELNDDIGMRDLFARYARTFVLNLELTSGGRKQLKDISIQVGLGRYGSALEPQVSDLAQAIRDKIPTMEDGVPAFNVIHWGGKDAEGTENQPNIHSVYFRKLESEVWTLCRHLSFSILNNRYLPNRLCTPEDVFEDLSTEVVKVQVPAIGKTILGMAQGQILFKKSPGDKRKRVVMLHGQVVGNAGSGAVFASHPMGERTFVRAYVKSAATSYGAWNDVLMRGVRVFPIFKANPYGEYSQRLNFNIIIYWDQMVIVDAARFGEDGSIRYFKDASPAVQNVFRTENVPTTLFLSAEMTKATPINIALFRCHHLQLFEQGNPKTMKALKNVKYLARQGLAEPKSFRVDALTAFVDPDFSFYVGLLDSASDNEQLQVYRAFMLNVDPARAVADQEAEIFGEGYLAADLDTFIHPYIDAAESMLRTNGKRIDLQKRYGMADELMLDFHTRGQEWLDLAKKQREEKFSMGAVLSAGKSLAYSINNHPVIRTKVSHAVIGILWYLGLLVPFVFFFEKLVFGFTDIRKQLLASAIIFLVVFMLLRMFHPAFQMVRSSIMILIGFIMLLLTALVTMMVGGKFQQNIRDLRSREGRVEGADVNRGGVVGTAFMLGLNNMRRRKVRTGLTCTTLVLITFVMICFTSVSTDLVNVEYPTGRTSWNGLFLRNPNFVPLDGAQVNSIKQVYGRQFPVRVTSWLTSVIWDVTRLQNAEILIDRELEVDGQKIQKRAKVSASVKMEWNEPQFSGMDKLLLTKPTWFPQPPSRQERIEAVKSGFKNQPCVILPDTVARDLDIAPDDVNTTNVMVMIRGDEYKVIGIIDSAAVNSLRGLDGRSILPYDLNSVQTLGRNSAGDYIVPEDVRPLAASQVIFVDRQPTVRTGYENEFNVSCSVLFPRETYRLEPGDPEFPAIGFKEQRRLVLESLERTGVAAYYGVDGISYYGSRMRARTLEGMLDLLIPILIAALTVFNTMRGSVYERRDEIYVYNAVGIAPNHVFFMFMAEACVYAVVGAMLGYLLSQASGRVLMALNMTGGLNMNYSSIEAIYASLTIVVAVLLSTIVPARDAARLAAPSEVRIWSLPEPENDTMSFELPFTFTPYERVAVISYFWRWLDANGEGSSGPFFCSPPTVHLQRHAEDARSGGIRPYIEATVWLKPYDLGVSQRLEIWLPADPQTGEYIASIRMVRLSGTSAAWVRTAKPFLGVLRKQFLNWRAASSDERAEMFAEAKTMMSGCVVEGACDG